MAKHQQASYNNPSVPQYVQNQLNQNDKIAGTNSIVEGTTQMVQASADAATLIAPAGEGISAGKNATRALGTVIEKKALSGAEKAATSMANNAAQMSEKALVKSGNEAVQSLEREAAKEGIQLTKHGAERIAGAAATRGGILSIEEVGAIRSLVKEPIIQADGAKVFIHQISPGRYSGFIENQNTGKLITTMNNWSKKSINKMGKNHGWSVE